MIPKIVDQKNIFFIFSLEKIIFAIKYDLFKKNRPKQKELGTDLKRTGGQWDVSLW
jgi:hypothetical protein